MIKVINKMRLLIVMLLSLIMLAPTPAFAQSRYGFAFWRNGEAGTKPEIIIIDPAQNNQVIESLPFPSPDGWGLMNIYDSLVLKGDWLAAFLLAPDKSHLMVQVWNIRTGETRQLASGQITMGTHYIEWSPDGNYLAMNIIDSKVDVDLWLYSIADDKLLNLTNDDFNQHDIAWTADSKKVMTFVAPCELNTSCAARLVIIDAATGSLLHSVNLNELPFLGNDACSPALSPDEQLVIFTSNCGGMGGAAYDFSREVYIWELETGTLKRLTNYYSGVVRKLFGAWYNYEWIDSHTVLLAADYQISGQFRKHELSILDLETNSRSTLSTDAGYGSLLSPNKARIALNTYFSDPDEFSATAAQVRLSSLAMNGNDISLGNDGESLRFGIICDAQWSPDGTAIAYHWIDQHHCLLRDFKVTFVDQTGSMISEFSGAADPSLWIMPIGWVQLT
ncbi:MAG: hypothetical protein KF726_23065 [Anaerolineae bacterium]|nr:hypothetical protein [Anaerolineae bacterium]